MQSVHKADLSLLSSKSRSIEQDSLSIRSRDKPTRSSPFQQTSTTLQLSKRFAEDTKTRRSWAGRPEDRPCAMFMHYTISEDRTGNDSSVNIRLLAGLGSRGEADRRVRTGPENHAVDHQQPIKDGDVQVDVNGGSEAETLIQSSEQNPEIGAVTSGAWLFVTGIHPSLSEQDLTRVFEKYGVVESCSIVVDPQSKESRGFGVVRMMTSEQADAARDRLQDIQVKGRCLSIKKARRARPRTLLSGGNYDTYVQPDAFDNLSFDYDSSGSTDGDLSDDDDLGRLCNKRKVSGPKPLTSEATSLFANDPYLEKKILQKRKAQNRAAQRVFRKQKEQHLKTLETKVEDLEKSSESDTPEMGLLRAQVERLQAELKEYRKRMNWISSDGSTRPLKSLGQPETAGSGQIKLPKFANWLAVSGWPAQRSDKVSETVGDDRQPHLCSMYMHYTISEDRCGDDARVKSSLLAALGARSQQRHALRTKGGGGDS